MSETVAEKWQSRGFNPLTADRGCTGCFKNIFQQENWCSNRGSFHVSMTHEMYLLLIEVPGVSTNIRSLMATAASSLPSSGQLILSVKVRPDCFTRGLVAHLNPNAGRLRGLSF